MESKCLNFLSEQYKTLELYENKCVKMNVDLRNILLQSNKKKMHEDRLHGLHFLPS